MKTKTFFYVAAMMIAGLFACECKGQSLPCGAASFSLFGNYGGQQVELTFVGIDSNLFNSYVYSLQGSGTYLQAAQAAYLHSALTNSSVPIAAIVVQIVVNSNGVPTNGPNSYISPSSPEFQPLLQSTLLWGYNQYNNVNLNFTNQLAIELAAWQWEDSIDATVQPVFTFAQYFGDIDSLITDFESEFTDQNSAAEAGDFATMIYDALQGYANFQATNSTQAAAVLNVLTSNGVVPGSNYTAALLVTGLANLTPQQLSTVEIQLESAVGIDSQNIPQTTQQYVDTFLKSLIAGGDGNAKSLAVGATSAGAYAGFTSYFGAQVPAGVAWTTGTGAAADYVAGATPPLAVLWVGNSVFDTLVTPQLPLQQDEFHIVHKFTQVTPELISIATNMMDSSGNPNFNVGTAFTADLGILNCLMVANDQISYDLGATGIQFLTGDQQNLAGTLALFSNAENLSQSVANNATGYLPPIVTGLGETKGMFNDEFTVYGSNLCNAVQVFFGNTPAAFVVNSSTNLTVVVPQGSGTTDVRVVGPGGVSAINANDEFTYNQSVITKILALSGDLTFGNVQVGTTVHSTLTIANNGNTNLTVSGISCPGGFTVNWSSGVIASGGNVNVSVAFTPTAAQNYGGPITISSDATGGTSTTNASGKGINVTSFTFGPLLVASVGSSSATINVWVYPNGNPKTTIYEVLGTSIYVTWFTPAGQTSPIFAQENLFGLQPATQYSFYLETAGGLMSQVVTFETAPAGSLPTIQEEDVNSISTNGAALHSIVAPDGQTTIVWFTLTAGSSVFNSQTFSIPANASQQDIGPWTAIGLPPATQVQWQITASNLWGTTSVTQDFETLPLPPSILNLAVTNVTPINATITGSLNPNSGENAGFWMQLTNITTGAVTNTPFIGIGDGNSPTNFSVQFTGLLPETPYSAFLIATNLGGNNFATVQFTTSSPPALAITQSPSGVLTITVTNLAGPCIVQTSTNLIDWVSLFTNIPPFELNLTTSSKVSFYRLMMQ